MKPQTRNPTDDETTIGLPTSTDLFAAFAARRRQYTFAYLTRRTEPVSIGELAAFIARSEGTPSTERYERVLTDLHHSHLPHLVDAGLVTYDVDTELVDLLVDERVIGPYLELADIDSDVVTSP